MLDAEHRMSSFARQVPKFAKTPKEVASAYQIVDDLIDIQLSNLTYASGRVHKAC